MNIKELIERLRFHSTHAMGVSDLDPPYVHEVFGRAADTMEKLLAVYEAANGVAINKGAARALAVKILIDVLAAVQTDKVDDHES